MPAIVEQSLSFVLRHVKNAANSSATVRKLRYNLANTHQFTDLFQHEQMIADAVRVDTYRDAIRRYVKPGDVVVDLGTGTGILSLLAAAQRPRVIYALDHSDLIALAKRIAEHNRVGNISFVKTHSRDFAPAEPVDVLLHEQMGDALLNENMVENLLDLKRRVLKPTGRILPGRFELFFEPVSLKDEYRVPYIWENRIHGLNFGFLRDDPAIEEYMPDYYECRSFSAPAIGDFLCDPVAALAFDLNEWTSAATLPGTIDATRTVVRSGPIDGWCLYFRVIFDEEIGFDTSPLSRHTHWSHRLYRTPRRVFSAGDTLAYRITLEDPLNPKQWRVRFAA